MIPVANEAIRNLVDVCESLTHRPTVNPPLVLAWLERLGALISTGTFSFRETKHIFAKGVLSQMRGKFRRRKIFQTILRLLLILRALWNSQLTITPSRETSYA